MSHMFAFFAGALAMAYLKPDVEGEWRFSCAPATILASIAAIILHLHGM